ncbi:MAG: PQQ-binding-like beta-propeller repeat protein [Planctomycetaceae bacterium]|nr:PQQ-binding-like beta-propeller repeat protein [Planctomycetaceae bacterium]
MRRHSNHTIILFVVLAIGYGIPSSLFIDCLQAQEWSRFRGPNGSGISETTDIPAQWTSADYNWRVELPGIGHSSPVVWGERLFLLSADPDNATRYMICLDRKTGEKIWQKEFVSKSHRIHARNSFASTTPAVDRDYVYVAWSTPDATNFLAFDHDGNPVWERDLGPFESRHGFGTSPIVYGDLVILCVQQRKPDRDGPRIPSSFILAVDRETGKTRWRTKRMSEVVSYSSPCIFKPDNGRPELIGLSTAHGVFSLNPETGQENWSVDAFSMRTVSSPIVADGLIFGTTGSGGGGNYVVAIHPGREAALAYEIKKQAPYVPCPVAKDGLLFLWSDKGVVTCVRTATGKKIWQQRVGGNYSGSPVIVDDRLYCIDEDGVVVVLDASDEFSVLGRNPLGESSRSTPAVADHRMYLRTNSHLVCIGGK